MVGCLNTGYRIDLGDLGDQGPVYVVVPAYNEARAIGCVLQDVAKHIPTQQIIVVDDGSDDDTQGLARLAGALTVRHAINRGQGAALSTGIELALRRGARVIVTFDADGQHIGDDLPVVIQPVLNGEADVVLGSRFLCKCEKAIPPARKRILYVATVFTSLLTGLQVTDAHNGFRAFSAQAVRRIHITQDCMAHASEICEKIRSNHLTFVERPVHIRYSDYSLGKGQKNRDALGLLTRVILQKLRSS